MKLYPQNPTDVQHPQQMHKQNPFNIQSFQSIQPQNPMSMHSYQPTQMQNEIPLPYYLQQHEITKNQISNFSQMPNAAESLQMTMNPYLMGGSSIISNKPLMVFTGTDPEYSVEDYLNAVTANLILNIGPEPIKSPLHQNWIYQLRKIAIKKRASHPSSIREPDLDFRKLVDKLEQAEITMKLEETENLKLQYANRIETNTTQINNIQESDTDLIEKITEILNIYEKNPNFKGKPSFKNWCNYCRGYGHSISECRQKQQDNQNKPQKHKKPNKSFYRYMKKDQNLPNNHIYSNNSSGKPLPNNTKYTRNQSPYNSSYRGRSPERRNTQNSSQNNCNQSNSRNNYSRSNSNATQFVSRSSSQSNPRNKHYSNNQSRNSSYNRNRN